MSNCSLIDLRLKVLTALSVVAITASLVSLVFRFKSDLMFNNQPEFNQPSLGKDDNDKPNWSKGRKQQEEATQLMTTPGDRSALEFTLIYTMWNSYLAALCFIYSPSSDASRGQC
ncbi:hypothetical protein D915_010936 [Fasciola hepatica]|uniref:Wntless-like transmembrane domain-containing protein n=1 Tax=Fasciola hepatica TaxID=6192 RepID=A0A4E0QSZ5_FASHE|nr:hypothetical protein D915_010936 [Fasciola hepatica]